MDEEVFGNAFLDRMRQQGDPLADACVARVFARHDADQVRQVLRTLVEGVGVPTEGSPVELQEYLRAFDELPLPDPAVVQRAQRVFSDLGPEMLMVLGFYSLPASYAAAKGAHVLVRTARLVRGPLRRVFETTQLVLDVMTPGGLAQGGGGIHTIQKVRLMHAAVRHLLRHDEKTHWDEAELGLPINQEDLAGTLMTFSYLVTEGLAKAGLPLSPDDERSWIECWAELGPLLGVDAALVPNTARDAERLTRTIQARQIHPSDEGKELTASLLEMYQGLIPGRWLDGLAPTLMRQFLPPDVADGLGVAPANRTRWLFRVGQCGLRFALSERWARGFFRRFNLRFLQALLDRERGGSRPPFDIPDSLADGWVER